MNLQTFLTQILVFINEIAIPFILAIAFLFFLFNSARYFILESGDESGREKARQSALWGILGFVIIASIWGIVNLFVSAFGFDRENAPCPDYNPDCLIRVGGSGSSGGGGGWMPSTSPGTGLDTPGRSECVFGISCVLTDGVRVCEYCFLSEF